jgi:hypothetical protein
MTIRFVRFSFLYGVSYSCVSPIPLFIVYRAILPGDIKGSESEADHSLRTRWVGLKCAKLVSTPLVLLHRMESGRKNNFTYTSIMFFCSLNVVCLKSQR